jgi:hypothetical protein
VLSLASATVRSSKFLSSLDQPNQRRLEQHLQNSVKMDHGSMDHGDMGSTDDGGGMDMGGSSSRPCKISVSKSLPSQYSYQL